MHRALRAATRTRHNAAERAMPLAAPEPTLAHYRDHLLLIHAWLDPLERWLSTFSDGPQEPGLVPRIARIRLIERDLADPSLHNLPTSQVIVADAGPELCDDVAWRWGAGYVIEGSQLGGAILLRRIGDSLAPHPLRFLVGDGKPGPRWQTYMRAMRDAVLTPEDLERACFGACETFDRLLALLPARGRRRRLPGSASRTSR